MRKKTLTKTALAFMIFATIFSFRNIINNQVQFGLFSIVLFLVGGIVYAIPLTLISIEFNNVKELRNNDAGIGGWCIYSLGKKYGFLASWSSYFANIFFFATIAPFTIISVSFTLIGGNGFDELAYLLYQKGISSNEATRISAVILASLSILLFWFATYISKKGLSWMKHVTNIGGVSSLILGIAFIIVSLLITIPFIFKGNLSVTFNKDYLNPMKEWGFKGDWWSMISSLPWVIMSYNGIETIAVFQKDVKGGKKTFKIGSIVGTILTIFLMVLCGLSMGMVINQNSILNDWGISNSYYYVFPALFNLEEKTVLFKILIRIIGLVTTLNGFGSLCFWTVAPSKVFFSEIPDNAMGKWLSITDENSTPKNALNMQAFVVTVILLLVGLTTTGNPESGSSTFLTTITQATTSLAIVPFIFLFIGYIRIRLKNETDKNEQFIKNQFIAISFSVFIISFLILALFFGIIPSPVLWKTNFTQAIVNIVLSLGGLIIFMGFAWLMWYINIERKAKINDKNLEKNKV